MSWCCKGVFEKSGARGCAESDLQKLKTLAWPRAWDTTVFRGRKARVLGSALVPAWGRFRTRCGECSLTCRSCVHGKTNQVDPGPYRLSARLRGGTIFQWKIWQERRVESARFPRFSGLAARGEGRDAASRRQGCHMATFHLTYSERMGRHLHVSKKESRSPSGNPGRRPRACWPLSLTLSSRTPRTYNYIHTAITKI